MIIFKPFSRSGCNIANARKLQNIIGDGNNKNGVLKNFLLLERGITSITNPF